MKHRLEGAGIPAQQSNFQRGRAIRQPKEKIAQAFGAVVMLAGMTSIGGVVVAGLFIGWMETIVGAYLGAAWQSFLPYLVVLLVMFIKPTGLFGEQRVERI